MEQSSEGSLVEDFVQIEDLISMTDTQAIQVEEKIQDLMKEIDSLKVDTTPAKTAWQDANAHENPLEGAFLFMPRQEEISNSATLLEKRLVNLEVTASSIETSLGGIEQILRESDKMRRIAYALGHADSPTDVALWYGIFEERLHYTDFVYRTLWCFRKGYGNLVPNAVLMQTFIGPCNKSTPKEGDVTHLDLQTYLLDHLHGLLGSRPRIGNDGKGNTTIFYD